MPLVVVDVDVDENPSRPPSWLLVLVVVFVAACAGDLPEASLIANLRILAITSEPAEAPPDSAVDLSALVVHPNPAAAIELAWLACAASSPTTSTGCLTTTLPPPCNASGDGDTCLLGTGDTVTWRLPPSIETQGLVTLAAALTGEGGIAACAQALTGGVVPEFCRVALKRINVLAAGATANRNPHIQSLTVDGERATVGLAPDAVEDDEKPFLSWFVDVGDLDDFRTDAVGGGLTNLWTPADASGRLWVVIRDGRGGETWAAGGR